MCLFYCVSVVCRYIKIYKYYYWVLKQKCAEIISIKENTVTFPVFILFCVTSSCTVVGIIYNTDKKVYYYMYWFLGLNYYIYIILKREAFGSISNECNKYGLVTGIQRLALAGNKTYLFLQSFLFEK